MGALVPYLPRKIEVPRDRRAGLNRTGPHWTKLVGADQTINMFGSKEGQGIRYLIITLLLLYSFLLD